MFKCLKCLSLIIILTSCSNKPKNTYEVYKSQEYSNIDLYSKEFINKEIYLTSEEFSIRFIRYEESFINIYYGEMTINNEKTEIKIEMDENKIKSKNLEYSVTCRGNNKYYFNIKFLEIKKDRLLVELNFAYNENYEENYSSEKTNESIKYYLFMKDTNRENIHYENVSGHILYNNELNIKLYKEYDYSGIFGNNLNVYAIFKNNKFYIQLIEKVEKDKTNTLFGTLNEKKYIEGYYYYNNLSFSLTIEKNTLNNLSGIINLKLRKYEHNEGETFDDKAKECVSIIN